MTGAGELIGPVGGAADQLALEVRILRGHPHSAVMPLLLSFAAIGACPADAPAMRH